MPCEHILLQPKTDIINVFQLNSRRMQAYDCGTDRLDVATRTPFSVERYSLWQLSGFGVSAGDRGEGLRVGITKPSPCSVFGCGGNIRAG